MELPCFFYFCPALKIQINILLFALGTLCASFSALSQSEDQELFTEYEMVDSKGLPHAGGATDDEVNTMAIFNEKGVELKLNTLLDSIRHIPAYETYCHWDTKNLFAHRAEKSALGDGVNFQLAYNECDFHYPATGIMTSPFGPRWGRMHYGLDIDLEVGDDVYAAFEGMVRISQYHSSYGNVVVIRHNNGLETLYAHMSQRKVLPGDHVESGDIIGLGGNTGRSYGAHLHFECRYMGQAFDPRLIVNPSAQALLASSFTLLPAHFESTGVSPQAVAARNSTTKSTKSNSTKSNSAKYHVVKKGDTLYSLAKRNGTSVSALCKMNKIKESSTLRLGQRLRVK
jgi:hypothetical protein